MHLLPLFHQRLSFALAHIYTAEELPWPASCVAGSSGVAKVLPHAYTLSSAALFALFSPHMALLAKQYPTYTRTYCQELQPLSSVIFFSGCAPVPSLPMAAAASAPLMQLCSAQHTIVYTAKLEGGHTPGGLRYASCSTCQPVVVLGLQTLSTCVGITLKHCRPHVPSVRCCHLHEQPGCMSGGKDCDFILFCFLLVAQL